MSKVSEAKAAQVSWRMPRPDPVPTRLKFRRRRLLRLLMRAGREAAAPFAGQPLTRENGAACRDAVVSALQQAGARYRHLRA